MANVNKDRETLKRLVESYGKQDVLKYVNHLNEKWEPRYEGNAEMTAFINNAISCMGRECRNLKPHDLGLYNYLDFVGYGLNQLESIAPDLDQEEAARFLFKFYCLANKEGSDASDLYHTGGSVGWK